MSNLIVGISDMKSGKDPMTIVTYALGSCVGICIYDSMARVGGLSHIMLPNSNLAADKSNRMRFADTAIPLLVKDLLQKGASKRRLTAKIAGGAQMFKALTNTSVGNIGARNVVAVKQALAKELIPIVAEDTGKDYGRTLYFYTNDGSVEVKSAIKGVKKI